VVRKNRIGNVKETQLGKGSLFRNSSTPKALGKNLKERKESTLGTLLKKTSQGPRERRKLVEEESPSP